MVIKVQRSDVGGGVVQGPRGVVQLGLKMLHESRLAAQPRQLTSEALDQPATHKDGTFFQETKTSVHTKLLRN